MSNALFDAMPATEPLVVPAIPEAGTPSRWLPGSVVGRVLETRDANGAVSGFYVLLDGGVQKITAFVADLLRTADSQGSADAPAGLARTSSSNIPDVQVLNVDFYPTGKLTFVDTDGQPRHLCELDEAVHRPPGDDHDLQRSRAAHATASLDAHIVTLGPRQPRSVDSVEAQQTLMLPGAANFVASTSARRHRRHPRKPVLGLAAGRPLRHRMGPGTLCRRWVSIRRVPSRRHGRSCGPSPPDPRSAATTALLARDAIEPGGGRGRRLPSIAGAGG